MSESDKQAEVVSRMLPERAEGLRAARSGLLFDACPYTFQACGFDKQRFDRSKLQAWWDGWSQYYMKTLGFLPHAKRMPHEAGKTAKAI